LKENDLRVRAYTRLGKTDKQQMQAAPEVGKPVAGHWYYKSDDP